MEPNCFGIIKGEQPLIRASRASKVAGAFLVLFWHAKETYPAEKNFVKAIRPAPHGRALHGKNHTVGILNRHNLPEL